MQERLFDGNSALTQLKYSGMTSVLELMKYGYPSRLSFGGLHVMYKSFLSPELSKLEPKIFFEAMLRSLRLNDKDFQFGFTKIFFRPNKFVEFDSIMKSDPESMQAIVANVRKFLAQSRWSKTVFGVICIIRLKKRNRCAQLIQKTVRGFLARKKHQPRYRGIAAISKARMNLMKLVQVSGEVGSSKHVVLNVLKQFEEIEELISNTIQMIKANALLQPDAIDILYMDIVAKIKSINDSSQTQLVEQRQEHLESNGAEQRGIRDKKGIHKYDFPAVFLEIKLPLLLIHIYQYLPAFMSFAANVK